MCTHKTSNTKQDLIFGNRSSFARLCASEHRKFSMKDDPFHALNIERQAGKNQRQCCESIYIHRMQTLSLTAIFHRRCYRTLGVPPRVALIKLIARVARRAVARRASEAPSTGRVLKGQKPIGSLIKRLSANSLAPVQSRGYGWHRMKK